MSNSTPAELSALPATPEASKACGRYLALAFALSWLVWFPAIRLGAGPGVGENILAFGTAGPALAAILLSRRREKVEGSRLPLRLLAFLVLWLGCWAIYVAREKLRAAAPLPPRFYLVVALLAMIPAWVATGAVTRDAGVRELLRTLVRPQNARWLAVALLFFPVILLIPAAVVHALGGMLVTPQSSGTLPHAVASGAVTFLYSLCFTGVLEEPGWRGFLLPRLEQRFSPLLASVLVWAPWALWHAPLDFSGPVGHSWMSYLQIRVVFFLPITIIFTWLYNRSGGNLLSTAIFHAGLNTFPFVLPYAPRMLGLILLWAVYAAIADRMWRPLRAIEEASALTGPPMGQRAM